jgi:acetyltransferase-like isoleucine patch superfamily enzyme
MMDPIARRPFSPLYQVISNDVRIGIGARIGSFVNLYGCTIGSDTTIGSFVEIQSDVIVGDRCKIGSHTFVCSGVEIEDDVFVGHNVSFTNDRHPAAVTDKGAPMGPADWHLERTVVRRGASIGSGATILCGLTIGLGSVVGAGAIVTRDIPAGATFVGNPAREYKSQS